MVNIQTDLGMLRLKMADDSLADCTDYESNETAARVAALTTGFGYLHSDVELRQKADEVKRKAAKLVLQATKSFDFKAINPEPTPANFNIVTDTQLEQMAVKPNDCAALPDNANVARTYGGSELPVQKRSKISESTKTTVKQIVPQTQQSNELKKSMVISGDNLVIESKLSLRNNNNNNNETTDAGISNQQRQKSMRALAAYKRKLSKASALKATAPTAPQQEPETVAHFRKLQATLRKVIAESDQKARAQSKAEPTKIQFLRQARVFGGNKRAVTIANAKPLTTLLRKTIAANQNKPTSTTRANTSADARKRDAQTQTQLTLVRLVHLSNKNKRVKKLKAVETVKAMRKQTEQHKTKLSSIKRLLGCINNHGNGMPPTAAKTSAKPTAQNAPILSMQTVMNQCKFCDKKFVKSLALRLHLLDHCRKIPHAARRQLTLKDMDAVRKFQASNHSSRTKAAIN